MDKDIDFLELPLGKRTPSYRLFEMITPLLSYAVIILAVGLTLIDPIFGAAYILALIIIIFVRAIIYLRGVIAGTKLMNKAVLVDWAQRLEDLKLHYSFHCDLSEFNCEQHQKNIKLYSKAGSTMPRVEDVYNLVIIAAYKEPREVIEPTIQSIMNTSCDKSRMIVCIAYEERGGEAIDNTVKELQKKYKNAFFDFFVVKHPKDLPNEVIGKGGNISFAAKQMSVYLKKKNIDSSNVIVTTLDSDNRPHRAYFDYVTYEFITRSDRNNLSYQPIALFLNNIWDVAAPIRVVSLSNSFWNVISTARTHALRNFASHSQPMKALEDMNYWSTRTIVEDGHQYWRSYFFFKGHYSVVPIHVPIYQDAVLSETFSKTLKAQFIQLRRWAYGVSDVPYVIRNIIHQWQFLPKSNVVYKLIQLIDGHVSLPTASLVVALGGWIPIIFGGSARSVAAHQLPEAIAFIQKISMVGILVSLYLSLKILPSRPRRYTFWRSLGMVAQWALIPFTAVFYSSMTAFYSQARLLTGRYFDKFDVTEKNVVIKD